MKHWTTGFRSSDHPDRGRTTPTRVARLATPVLALGATLIIWLSSSLALAQTEDLAGATTITLGTETTIVGTGASADGGHVTIDAAGIYVIVGSTPNGSVTVDAAGADVNVVLDGVSITSLEGPAIFFKEAASATVTLAAGSANVISDGGESEYDAALYSDTSLTIDGSGSLDVHAVYEGISSTMHITILGGAVRIYAGEDGINANEDGISHITISGGYVYIATTAGDGIDSNGAITITGGVVVSQAALVGGDSGLDADGAITIDGGMVIATGGAMMGAVADGSTQKTIVVDFDSIQETGALIVVRDEAGTELVAFAPSLPYQQFLLSAPTIADGVTYTVSLGGVASGEVVDGLYSGVSADPGTVVASVTTDSARGGGRFGGPRGMPGGPPGQPGGPGFPPGFPGGPGVPGGGEQRR